MKRSRKQRHDIIDHITHCDDWSIKYVCKHRILNVFECIKNGCFAGFFVFHNDCECSLNLFSKRDLLCLNQILFVVFFLASCDFEESDTCTWLNDVGDQFDWIVWQGHTHSNNTGPTNDFTFGNSSGKSQTIIIMLWFQDSCYINFLFQLLI